MSAFEIGCVCGAVGVTLSGEPMMQFYCHCGDCRAANGGAYAAVAVFPRGALVAQRGETITTSVKSLPRERCARCGVAVFARLDPLDAVGINAFRLPDGGFEPKFHIHCGEAVLPIGDDLPHFRKLPPQFGGTNEQVDW